MVSLDKADEALDSAGTIAQWLELVDYCASGFFVICTLSSKLFWECDREPLKSNGRLRRLPKPNLSVSHGRWTNPLYA